MVLCQIGAGSRGECWCIEVDGGKGQRCDEESKDCCELHVWLLFCGIACVAFEGLKLLRYLKDCIGIGVILILEVLVGSGVFMAGQEALSCVTAILIHNCIVVGTEAVPDSSDQDVKQLLPLLDS